MTQYERRSDVDGYTIVWRRGRAPKVHLLRSWDECNVELARKAGVKTEGVPGSRELLMERLHGKAAEACLRCFPQPEVLDPPALEEQYADPIESDEPLNIG